LEENKHEKHRQKGISITNAKGGIFHHSHKSSSLGHNNREVNTRGREKNEGCAGDRDGRDRPRY